MEDSWNFYPGYALAGFFPPSGSRSALCGVVHLRWNRWRFSSESWYVVLRVLYVPHITMSGQSCERLVLGMEKGSGMEDHMVRYVVQKMVTGFEAYSFVLSRMIIECGRIHFLQQCGP